MIPSIMLAEATTLLEPHIPALLRSLRYALKEWNTGLAQYQVAFDASARAIILNRLTYHAAGLHLEGVTFREDQLQRYVVVNERLLLRVKLLDAQLKARNYPTRRARQWVRQLSLAGIPEISRLHFGYRLDVTGTVIEDVFITLPNGDPLTVNDWVWQVYGKPVEAFAPLNLFGDETYRYDDFAQAI